jgi:hypothetical protein
MERIHPPGETMRFISTTIAVAAALPLLATACSAAPSAGTPTSASSASSAPASSAPASSAAPANPDAGLLTGTQLEAALQPAATFPDGFTLDPGGSVDTGATFEQASASTGATACTRLDGTDWVDLAGPVAVSFAENDYFDRSTSEQFAQEVDAYPGTGAQAVMAGLRKVPVRCPTFPNAQTSSTVTVKLVPGPALGDDALTIILSSPRWRGDIALEAVRVGTSVVTVLHSATSGTGVAMATALARAITAKVKSTS